MSNGFQIKENKSQGFIKVYRSFMGWEWYDDSNTKDLFLHCLLRANYEDAKWHGITIPRGSFLTSVKTLEIELNKSTQNIKTALKHLKATNEITIETTSNYSIITVNNYDYYNSNNKQDNEQITNEEQTSNEDVTIEQQSNNNQVTTNKNNKKEKNNKNNKNNFVAKSFFQKLFTDDSEYQKNNSHLKDLFIEFLEYKTAIKKQFKTESGVENAFKDFIRLSENNAELGRALVDNSIARGWQSIYDLSTEQRKAFKNAQIKNQQMNDKNYGGF